MMVCEFYLFHEQFALLWTKLGIEVASLLLASKIIEAIYQVVIKYLSYLVQANIR